MPVKYPNQKQITVHKEACDTQHIYARINKKAMFRAMKTFSGRKSPSFALWCYIASSASDRVFVLSQKAMEEEIGMKQDAYETAVQNLIDAGYLIRPNEDKKTIWDFYEIPQTKEEQGA